MAQGKKGQIEKDNRLFISIDSDLKEKASIIARKKDESLSKAVRDFLRKYIAENKDLL